MNSYKILSDYIFHAMKNAEIVRLDDGTYAGRIPQCQGVVAFGKSPEACKNKLQTALEGWILLGLKSGHSLPVIRGINLNQEPYYEHELGL